MLLTRVVLGRDSQDDSYDDARLDEVMLLELSEKVQFDPPMRTGRRAYSASVIY